LAIREQYKYTPSNLKLGVNTFLWNLQLTTLDNLDGFGRTISSSFGYIFDLLDNLVSFEDLTENNVTAIEPARLD
jgi:hypothetical protein